MDDAFYEMKDVRIKPWLSLTKFVTDIDKCNLLSPLMVIETLAHNSTATLGVVKVIDAFFYLHISRPIAIILTPTRIVRMKMIPSKDFYHKSQKEDLIWSKFVEYCLATFLQMGFTANGIYWTCKSFFNCNIKTKF